MTTETKVFTALGILIIAIAGLYWWTSYEDAGTTMLTLAGLLGLMIAAYLWRQERLAPTTSRADDEDRDNDNDREGAGSPKPWLPHTSVWPFWTGVGVLLIANGLILGSWFLIPGGLVLLFGLTGYAAQSRARR